MKKKQRIAINLHIVNLVNYKEIENGFYEKIAEQTLKYVHYPLDFAEITLVLCDNDFICNLNNKYRALNRPTDVLSFPMNEDGVINDPLLGDIVISIDMVKKNCLESQLTYNEEVIYLFTHGLLHLLGYDHECSKDIEDEMYNIQDQIMKYLHNFMS
jgi:probable rRNA maturation factor